MANLYGVMERVLADQTITRQEVDVIRQHIHEKGRLDLDDVRLLVQLLVEARDVCPEFDALFFPVLKDVILADGQVQHGELFYLFKMIYGDGRVRDSERAFLRELQREAVETTPEFDAFCAQVLAGPDAGWSVDGRARVTTGRSA